MISNAANRNYRLLSPMSMTLLTSNQLHPLFGGDFVVINAQNSQPPVLIAMTGACSLVMRSVKLFTKDTTLKQTPSKDAERFVWSLSQLQALWNIHIYMEWQNSYAGACWYTSSSVDGSCFVLLHNCNCKFFALRMHYLPTDMILLEALDMKNSGESVASATFDSASNFVCVDNGFSASIEEMQEKNLLRMGEH